jgi:hypothetical protein
VVAKRVTFNTTGIISYPCVRKFIFYKNNKTHISRIILVMESEKYGKVNFWSACFNETIL